MSKTAHRRDTCAERVQEHFESRMDDLRRLWEAYQNGEDEEGETYEELGSFHEYGLSLDFRPADEKHEEGFLCFLLSWGGPSEEFRFFLTPARRGWKPYRVEYWFLDWFDGAPWPVTGDDYALLCEIFEMWDDCETVDILIKQACDD